MDAAYNKIGACLIALALGENGFPLVLGANRDEDYDRPTLPAQFWTDAPEVLGGRDALHGGTWLAINRSGRFAAVTNLRGSTRDPNKKSRGVLVSGFVLGASSPAEYMQSIDVTQYAGFHLLAGSADEVVQLSGTIETLSRGIHALSNAPAGERWPKVEIAKDELRNIIRDVGPETIADDVLRFLSASRGTKRVESEVFIAGERYGTRSSTAIVITASEILFAEQSFARGGKREGSARRFRFGR